jgi:hypothetical protein
VQNLNPNRARAVATVAYSFVYPLVASYCAMYHATVDTSSPKFNGGFGAWRHVGVSDERKQEVGRPREPAVRSSVWLDLRSEPWWFTVGEIPPEVHFTVRWVDLWGFVLEEGSAAEHALRPTSVLASAPVPVHDVPAEIDRVVSGESSFIALLTASRWRDPYALPGVLPVPPDITLEPVSARLGQRPPKPAPGVDWWPCHEASVTTDEFWSCANFALSLVTPNQDDRPIRDRIAEIGLVAGRPWDASTFPAAVIDAIREGMDDALSDLMEAATTADTRHSGQYRREDMDRDYFGRALRSIHTDREVRT